MMVPVGSCTMTQPMGTSSIDEAFFASAIASSIHRVDRSDITSSTTEAQRAQRRIASLCPLCLCGNWNLRLLHRHDCRDFRDLFSQVSRDPVLQGHRAARAAMAGAVEADLNDAFAGDVDQLDVAAVGLHRGADQVDHTLHPLADRLL